MTMTPLPEAWPLPTHPYKSPDYGSTFRSILDLHASSIAPVTWIKRPIDGSEAFDFAGPYPCISLPEYGVVADELEALRATGGVSAVFVTSAFDGAEVARVLGAP